MTATAAGTQVQDEARAAATVTAVADDLPEIRFVRPVPGFPEHTRYVLVRLDGEAPDGADGAAPDGPDRDGGGLLYELRCLEDPQVRFLVGVPDAFFPEYAVELDDVTCEELALTAADDALVLVVLSTSGDGTSTTANLLAPVVINARLRVAAQVILSGTEWPVRAVVA